MGTVGRASRPWCRLSRPRPENVAQDDSPMDWMDRASYSRYHPDNLNKEPPKLPEPVKGPPPAAKMTEVDKSVGFWGHSLSCERPYGPSETRCALKEGITPKVGQNWNKIVAFERGTARSHSAMYGGSYRELSFEEIVEIRGKKG